MRVAVYSDRQEFLGSVETAMNELRHVQRLPEPDRHVRLAMASLNAAEWRQVRTFDVLLRVDAMRWVDGGAVPFLVLVGYRDMGDQAERLTDCHLQGAFHTVLRRSPPHQRSRDGYTQLVNFSQAIDGVDDRLTIAAAEMLRCQIDSQVLHTAMNHANALGSMPTTPTRGHG